MATYKVIQDIEAEDKLIGPLTLRQFIYAGIACLAAYLSFLAATKGAAFMIVFLLPVVVVAGFFAFPWKGEQPTEVWALAKIRFMVKPRKRVWDQSGAKELVTITAPKRIQVDYTNGLSQNEVHSRLKALADTIDSRGWAIKNTNVNMYAPPALVMAEPSDRLVAPSVLPQEVDDTGVVAADDMLDEQNNHVAQQVDNMIEASAKAHRQRLIDELKRPDPPKIPEPAKTPANNYWFLNQAPSASVPNDMVTFNTQVVTPGVIAGQDTPAPSQMQDEAQDEEQLVETLKERKEQLPMSAYYGHLHTIQPLSAQAAAQQQVTQATQDAQPAPASDATLPSPGYNIAGEPLRPGLPKSIGGTNGTGPYAGYDYPVSVGYGSEHDHTYHQTQQPGQQIPANTTAPADNQSNQTEEDKKKAQAVTPSQQAAILQLASNDDLNVATIAREAQRSGLSDGEVVIKLH